MFYLVSYKKTKCKADKLWFMSDLFLTFIIHESFSKSKPICWPLEQLGLKALLKGTSVVVMREALLPLLPTKMLPSSPWD